MELNTTIAKSFEKWQDFLGKSASFLEKLGLSDNNIAGLAKGLGDFLAKGVDPENPQQRVLKDLWDSADDHERHVLAKLVMRMSKHHAGHTH